jgi:hypothetical protein
MASFAELVRLAARAATSPVAAGSRRNARAALETRYETLRHSSEVLATLAARPAAPIGPAVAAQRQSSA